MESKFSIASETYEKMLPQFIAASNLIKEAISDGRPIILRHHGDCDGYSAATALEQSIVPLIIRMHPQQRNIYRFFTRIANYTPFLVYTDVLRDLSFIEDPSDKRNVPLLIIADTGSTADNIFMYKKYKAFGVQGFIIVDHHTTKVTNGKSEVADFVDVHINPHLVGGDSNISAGMLGFELSQFIRKNTHIIIPAVSGIADKCEGEELEAYIALAAESGWDRKMLEKIGQAIDFDAYHIRGDGRNIINYFFLSDKSLVEKNVAVVLEEFDRRCDEVRGRIKEYAAVEDKGKHVVVTIDLNATRHREYPADGKTTSLAIDYFKEKYPGKDIVTLGCTDETVTFRATKIKGFDMNQIVQQMSDKYPNAKIGGGGHAVAGTMKFNAELKEEAMDPSEHISTAFSDEGDEMMPISTIQFVSGTMVSFLGIIIGYVLSLIAPEELAPGEKHLLIMQKILIGIVLSGVIYIFYPSKVLIPILFLVFVLALWIIPLPIWASMILSGAALVFSAFISIPVFMAFAALALLMGIVDGTLHVYAIAKKEKMFGKDKELHVILKSKGALFGKTLIIPSIIYGCIILLFFLSTFWL